MTSDSPGNYEGLAMPLIIIRKLYNASIEIIITKCTVAIIQKSVQLDCEKIVLMHLEENYHPAH